jgi:hypothetical protein
MKEEEFDLTRDNLKKLVKTANNNDAIGILYSTRAGEYKFIFDEFAKDFIMNSENPLINAHYVHNFCINETLNFFINVIEQACIDEHDDDFNSKFSRKDYFNNAINKCFERLDQIDNEFKKTACKIEPTLTAKKFDEVKEFIEKKFNDLKPKEETGVMSRNEKILKLKQELNADGGLLDDLITVPPCTNLEAITEKYWKYFEYVTPEMFTEFICQSKNKPYSEATIIEAIKKTKPPVYHRKKTKK